MSELKSCPFCGGEADKLTSSDGFTSIGCLRCNPVFGVMVQAPTEAEAAAAWNTRHVEMCHERETRDHIKCGYCGLNIESVLQLHGCNEHAIKFCPNCGRKVVEG